MELKNGNFCPLIKKQCIGLQCSWFTQIRGNNPNTGKEIDEYGCSMAWLPILLIEGSMQQRQTGAAVESFRNEMVKANKINTEMLIASVNNNQRLIEG